MFSPPSYAPQSEIASPNHGTPMMLGSPAGSPSPQMSQYLPGYLMGEPPTMQHSPSSRVWSGTGGSPSKSMSHHRTFGSTSVHPYGMVQQHQSSHLNTSTLGYSPHSQRSLSSVSRRTGKEKSGAPPIQGLLDGSGYQSSHLDSSLISPERRKLDYSVQCAKLASAEDVPNVSSTNHASTPINRRTPTPGSTLTPFQGTTFPSGLHSNSFQPVGASTQAVYNSNQSCATPPSPAQLDPFYTQGENLTADEDLDETWVTVFGFPPAAASYILQQFSQYGNILEHKVAAKGNWLHIHYQSKLQAKKALSKNGRVFGDEIMVGVSRCIDKSVMAQETNSRPSLLSTSTLGKPSVNNHASPFEQTGGGRASIRPLTAAYRAASSEHEVVAGRTPQKSNNVISNAMEYIFGW
ncbi:PREDICTED: nucleoporin NUP53-like [Priapulus caudatus]|uniref:Nucleoporin NUP35 n=1 Tax=Priapulus caudatus TaxID=37621 RepID=A0ABM1E1N6_PRICU|nr:PREDICTED: nucleoporin NUP53-like [Priapulus caudatus]